MVLFSLSYYISTPFILLLKSHQTMQVNLNFYRTTLHQHHSNSVPVTYFILFADCMVFSQSYHKVITEPFLTEIYIVANSEEMKLPTNAT